MASPSVFAKALNAGRAAPSSVRTGVAGAGASAGRGAAPQPKASAAGSRATIAAHARVGKASAPGAKAKAKATASAIPSSASAVGEEEEQEATDGGVLTCANRGLLQQMLSGVLDEEEDDEKENESDDGENGGILNMSLRHVPAVQKAQGKNVPTITSPAGSARPVSRGGVPAISNSDGVRPASRSGLESQGRPVSRGGLAADVQTRGRQCPPGASVQVVTTGPPRPSAATYVSAPRPGSRGAGGGAIPPSVGEVVVMSPAGRSRQPVQRPGVQPQRAAPGGQVGVPAAAVRTAPGSGYAGMHQLRVQKHPASPAAKPFSPAAKPAVRPLCGPSAFDVLKKLDEQKQVQAVADEGPSAEPQLPGLAEVMAEADDNEDGFVMPASDPESDDAGPSRPANAARIAAVQPDGESAADYVERVKRGFGLGAGSAVEAQPSQTQLPHQQPSQQSRKPQGPPQVPSGDVAAAFAQLGLPPPQGAPTAGTTATPAARSRSSDARQQSSAFSAPAAPLRAVPRSRSSDPRAHVLAARAYSPQVSDDEDDDDDDETSGQGIQWKADVRSMVKNFAQEERTKLAKASVSSTASRPTVDSGGTSRKPPRAPMPGAEQGRRAAGAEEETPTSAVSKKPRVPVDYTPATVEDYKQRFGGKPEKNELGRLGPDLDDENLMMKKAVQEKVKQFSKELHRINRQRSVAHGALPKEPAPKAEPKPTARSKALEFAKKVPKPKVQPQTKVIVTSTKPPEEDQEAADLEELRRREKQHFEDKAKVLEIKEFLERLPF